MLNTAIPLSLAEKLDFIPALVSLCATVVWAMFTGLWRSSSYPKSWLLHVGYAAFRKATSRLSVAQMQYVMPPISLLCMLTATGGGFALPANLGYFSFFTRLIADSGRANKSLAVFSLTYTLAPHATYPTQIRQAVEALRYVVEQTKFSPGHILLGGDSAGGNLVGGVLSHLAHPHPAIAPVNLSEHLRGAVMIAPWTSMETDFSGQEIDSRGDLITPAVAGPWASAYLGTAKRDYYTDLSTAPADWYSTFPVQKILVCAGGSEILFPIIQDFVKKLKEGFPGVELCVGQREGHVAPIYNLYIGDQTETEQGKRVKSWLRETL